MNAPYQNDILGITTGFFGYIVSVILGVIPSTNSIGAIPNINEIINSIIIAGLCSLTGFLMNKLLYFIWKKIKTRNDVV